MKSKGKLGTRKLSPVTTAVVLILVLGAVLYVYTRGLLGVKRGPLAKMGGGGGASAAPEPPKGLPTAQITTVAGYVEPGLVEGVGWDARFNGPAGIAAAPDGSLYVADSRNHRIRRIAPDTAVTTVAGSGPTDCIPGGFADGPASQARLFNPCGIAVASDGAVYFADSGNHRVRKLKDGVVSTVAGSATPTDELGCEQGGYRDGPAGSAQFRFPAGLVVVETAHRSTRGKPEDAGVVIYVADLGNGRVRRIANGLVTTVPEATSLREPIGLGLGPEGTIDIADQGVGKVFELSASGHIQTRQLEGPMPRKPTAVCRLEADPSVLAVTDAEWRVVYLMNNSKSVLLAGVLPLRPAPGFRDGSGDEARFAWPCALTSIGNRLFLCDYENNCIRSITVPPEWAAPQERRPERLPRRAWRPRRDGGRSEN